MTVDREFLTQWAAALRSGEYKQGTGCLRSRDDCYCVLGVACDVAFKQRMISGAWVEYDNDFACGTTGVIAFMPQALATMIGMGVDGSMRDRYDLLVPIVIDKDRSYVSLLDANDNGATFEELAQVIEELVHVG